MTDPDEATATAVALLRAAGWTVIAPGAPGARNSAMRLLFICVAGHVLSNATSDAPTLCDACHPDFDWSNIDAPVPRDEIWPLIARR